MIKALRSIYTADPSNLWFFRVLVLIALAGIYACLGVLATVLFPMADQIVTILEAVQ